MYRNRISKIKETIANDGLLLRLFIVFKHNIKLSDFDETYYLFNDHSPLKPEVCPSSRL